MLADTLIWCPPIDPDAEDLVPATDASAYPRRPSRSAIFRWIKDGVLDRATGRKKRLATVQIGGRLFTSREAIRRFNAGPGTPGITPSQQKLRAQAAMAALEAAGL